jgi:UDP-N-acetyl-D-mannosaminuronic acid transferase (WecB/TagA/CpsF family)
MRFEERPKILIFFLLKPQPVRGVFCGIPVLNKGLFIVRETIVILGIPIDNRNMAETIEQILSLVEAYGRDGRARQVATVNVDFVVNTLTWRLSRPRHPELLDILRKADLVTPDGMPMVWASRLLGTPLKERVTGADLVPRLAEAAAEHEKSTYFLGGQGGCRQTRSQQVKKPIPESENCRDRFALCAD